MASNYLNQTKFAQTLGISQERVSLLTKQGIFRGCTRKIGKRLHYHQVKGAAAYEAGVSPVNRRAGGGAKKKVQEETIKKAGLGAETGFSEARTWNEKYKAALKKLEFEQKSGKLISVDEVEKRGFDAGRMIKEQCLSIADRCSPLVAAEADQFKCKQILVKEISRILEGLSDALNVKG